MAGECFPLDAVISNDQLSRRPARAADRRAQRVALDSLAQELLGSPRRVLQSLSDAALQLCRAHSAGISLLEEEDGVHVFRWHAVSGQFSSYLWSTLPRDFSPCGVVLDRGAPQLMVLPERHFTPLAQISPKVHEVLLIPFSLGEVIVGTVWIVAHDETLRFDREDRRVVASLAEFAAVAYAGLSSLSSDDVVRLARLSKGRALPSALPAKSIQRRVLIVDDKRDAADSLAAVLRQMGHQVDLVHDGRTGMEFALRMRPHVVLMDVAIHGMSGLELGREMRQALGPEVRIVAITGYGSDEDRRQSLEAGFDQHLVKPVDPAFLRSLIR
jgi:CheY-like chemotaxis protein